MVGIRIGIEAAVYLNMCTGRLPTFQIVLTQRFGTAPDAESMGGHPFVRS